MSDDRNLSGSSRDVCNAAVMTDDEILAAATTPWGAPRFYPRGQHPACAKWREQLAKLQALPESPERDQLIEYAEFELARFEVGEDRAKRLYVEATRGR